MSAHSNVAAITPDPDVTELSDRTLLQRVAAKDLEALRELHSRHQRDLQFYIARLTLNIEIASTLACDTWLEIWMRARQYRGQCRATVWIYRIAHCSVLAALRRHRAFQPLSADQRAVLALVYGLCWPSEEVASVIGCDVPAVRALMFSATHPQHAVEHTSPF